uniref:GIR1-like zinc ribbon domain-containing protein n=1 Tax=Anthurium amnicola TaxID=1678845 RepID=A0A1D1Y2V1_9ARAE
MAAEVSYLMRVLGPYDKEDGVGGEGNRSDGLVTRDLLGGCCGGVAPAGETKEEVGLGPRSPSRWAKRLHLAAGKVGSDQGDGCGGGRRGVQDLNMPPLCCSGFPPLPRPAGLLRPSSPLREEPSPALDLKLRSPAPPPAGYQSVCTLEKVKSALERAQRESQRKQQQQPPLPPLPPPSASPASSSTTTSSAKRRREAGKDEEAEGESRSSSSSSSVVVQGDDLVASEGGGGGGGSAMAAAACPSCLLYVLISRRDPRCPRCSATVPLPPAPSKKPRVDPNAGDGAAPSTQPPRTMIFF